MAVDLSPKEISYLLDTVLGWLIPMMVSKKKKKKAAKLAISTSKICQSFFEDYFEKPNEIISRSILTDEQIKEQKKMNDKIILVIDAVEMLLSCDDNEDVLELSSEFANKLSLIPKILAAIIVRLFNMIIVKKYGETYKEASNIIGDFLLKLHHNSMRISNKDGEIPKKINKIDYLTDRKKIVSDEDEEFENFI